MKHLVLILPAMLLVVGCNKSNSATTQDQPSASSPSNLAGASDSFDTPNYKLVLQPPASITKGKPAMFQVSLTTKGNYHINDEYPYRFQCRETAGTVSCAKKQVVKADGTFSKTKAVLPVTFTVGKAGAVTIGGEYRFSVCSEQNCLMEKKTLMKQVQVQ